MSGGLSGDVQKNVDCAELAQGGLHDVICILLWRGKNGIKRWTEGFDLGNGGPQSLFIDSGKKKQGSFLRETESGGFTSREIRAGDDTGFSQ